MPESQHHQMISVTACTSDNFEWCAGGIEIVSRSVVYQFSWYAFWQGLWPEDHVSIVLLYTNVAFVTPVIVTEQ